MKRSLKIKKLKSLGKYHGFSLVELLVTIIVVMIILMLVSVTLTTMLKTSLMTNSKNTARQESEFVLEMVRRSLKASAINDIKVYKTSGRTFNGTNIQTSAAVNFVNTQADGSAGNEIQFIPSTGEGLVCIAFYKNSGGDKGYMLRTSAPSTYTVDGYQIPSIDYPRGCFDPDINTSFREYFQLLNSFETNIVAFDIRVTTLEEGNSLFLVDLTLEPVRWVPGRENSIDKTVRRQTTVTTEKITY